MPALQRLFPSRHCRVARAAAHSRRPPGPRGAAREGAVAREEEVPLAERTLSQPLSEVQPEQFFGVDIRSAVVTEVRDFPEARRPAYQLRLDLGPLGERVSSAQVTNYSKDELLGSTVVCVVNFPPRRIAGFKSDVLVLGVYDPNGNVILLRPDRPVPPGQPVG
jgi:tRNA-binding protein